MTCLALTARGRRCSRPHVCAFPITLEWDPIQGVGTGAPDLPLCRMHDYLWQLPKEDRLAVVGGWAGASWNAVANVWTVLTTVYEAREGDELSRHWWALRRPIRAGVPDHAIYGGGAS